MNNETEMLQLRKRVHQLEVLVAMLCDRLNVQYSVHDTATELSPPVIALLEQGEIIQAIKLHREIHNIGLRESKDAIDNYLNEQSKRKVSGVGKQQQSENF